MISFDTETTGLDLRHGARPFLVTYCDESGEPPTFYEWDINPLTREPIIPPEDLVAIREVIEAEDALVLQNPKFDATAMESIGGGNWPWAKTYDTLLAGHLLESNQPHDLTTMVLVYLGKNIEPYEKAVRDACIEARRIAKSKFPEWRTAKKGLEDLPSARDATWKYDMWLPRQLARELDYPEDHEWYRVTAEYANSDSFHTIQLWRAMEEEIKRRGLWEIYEVRLKVLPIAYKMESRGVTINGERVNTLRKEFSEASEKEGKKCVALARGDGFDLTLPKSGNNKSLGEYLSGVRLLECPRCSSKYRDPIGPERLDNCPKCMAEIEDANNAVVALTLLRSKLSVKEELPGLNLWTVANPTSGFDKGKGNSSKVQNNVLLTDTGNLAFNKAAIEHYLETFERTEPNGKRLRFLRSIKKKRRYDTAGSFLDGYARFWKKWIPVGPVDPLTGAGWYVLHPSLNPTGTDTLRWSSSNPNEQNISKQETECDLCRGEGCDECHGTGIALRSLRWCFGPGPGREWYSCDARNIELRLPAYESEERELIELFERPKEPPYYGSTHLLNFHTIYPEIWAAAEKKVGFEKVGPYCKEEYDDSWYQWCKNGGFAVQYGAVDRDDGQGTADRAFHRPGAHKLLKKRFSRLEKLNQACIDHANRFGYVETIPDKTVSTRGYPLNCTRSNWGKILPTVPLNYHIQGTAMWWMMKAMIRCQGYLDELNRACKKPGHYAIALQVHDELVFDFPKGSGPEPWKTNLTKVEKLRSLMEQSGDDLGIPTPVSLKYHADNWSQGVSI